MIELLLPYGFDTLEYSCAKAAIASVCMQIILWLRNANILLLRYVLLCIVLWPYGCGTFQGAS
jgi:hypothetical protein